MTTHTPNLTMDAAERDALLSEPHVGILAVAVTDGPPLLTPVWYRHVDDGDIVVVAGARSRKVREIVHGAAVSFIVQSETPPRYVSAEVVAELQQVDDANRRAIAERYVPEPMLDDYLAMTAGAESVLVRLRPTRWRTSDLTKTQGPAPDPTTDHDRTGDLP